MHRSCLDIPMQLVNSGQQGYVLDVMGTREHVYGLYFGGVVAVLVEVGQVAGQGGRVTGDVDDAFRFALGDGFEDRFAAAGPGRVEDDDVRTDAIPDEFRQFIDGIPQDELGIADVVVLGIADGVADGRGDDFDAIDLLGFLGQEQGNRPGTAVDVSDGFAAFEVGKVEGRFIEALGLFAVDLEEGLGRNVEGQGPDGIVNGPLAVNGLGLGS